jgi:hypothetical protein
MQLAISQESHTRYDVEEGLLLCNRTPPVSSGKATEKWLAP